MQSVLTLFGFWPANLVMNWGVAFFGYNGLIDPATLPLLIIALSVFGLVTMPLGNLWSRWRKVKADEYALAQATRLPPLDPAVALILHLVAVALTDLLQVYRPQGNRC